MFFFTFTIDTRKLSVNTISWNLIPYYRRLFWENAMKINRVYITQGPVGIVFMGSNATLSTVRAWRDAILVSRETCAQKEQQYDIILTKISFSNIITCAKVCNIRISIASKIFLISIHKNTLLAFITLHDFIFRGWFAMLNIFFNKAYAIKGC